MEKDSSAIIRKKYYFTIGNISAVVAIIFGIYYFFRTDRDGWNFIFGCGLLIYSFLIFLADQILQTITRKYWIITLIEIVIIAFTYYQTIH